MSINGREPACSVLYKITIIEIFTREKLQTPFYFVYKIRQNSHMYSYYQYITMNYCEDGLHAIKLMAEVYLREIRMSLLFVWKCQHFSLEFLYMQWVI